MEKICKGCGKQFVVPPSWSWRTYCNIACYHKHRPDTRVDYSSVETIKCKICFVEKPVCDFYDAQDRYGRKRLKCGVCKPCYGKRQSDRYHSTPGVKERVRDRQRRKRLAGYGLTPESYDAILAAQGGGCAVCGKASKKLCVDHDHVTGKARGLLCGTCNTAIGALGDTVEKVWKAVAYLSAAST